MSETKARVVFIVSGSAGSYEEHTSGFCEECA